MTMPIYSLTTVVPIADADRETAAHFAQQQPTRKKAAQVYRNTLAVLATKHCLDLLDVPTDLAESDSWNPFSCLAGDVADLYITGLGRLECRPMRLEAPPCDDPNDATLPASFRRRTAPVDEETQYCYVPPDVWENRIGYFVIQLDAFYQEATIRGFSAGVHCERLAIAQLQPLEALLLHLEWLREQATAQGTVEPLTNHLKQWLSDTIDTVNHRWQPMDVFLGRLSAPVFAFRSLWGRALITPEYIKQIALQLDFNQKSGYQLFGFQDVTTPRSTDPDFQAALVHLIQTTEEEEIRWEAAEVLWGLDPGHPATGVRQVLDLGLLLANYHLALMVAVLQVNQQHLSILARVYPVAEQDCLPAGLQLAVLCADGSVGLETQARERDSYMELKLKGEWGERFSLRLGLGHDVLTEHFVL